VTGLQSTDEEPERFGRFVIVRNLRRGGMGLASLAVDTASGRIVVIKRAAKQGGTDAIRFRSEMELSRELGNHPHLVEAIEAGAVDGCDYLALEWIAGPDVEALLERAGRFGRRVPVGVAAAILRQVCSAFEYAHGRLGFVHRDVKPANIVVSYTDGVAKLIDYGGALSTYKRAKTEVGQVFGTVGYIAPELRQGLPATERSDLYALGAVLAFMLTGLVPFGDGEDGNSKDVLRERLEVHAGKLPAAVLTFLWRAMQKNPKNRYESAAEMGKALEASAPIATPAEVGAFVSALFPADKERDGEYATEWRRQFGPAAAPPEKTAVMRAVAPAAAKGGERSTMVIDRAPPTSNGSRAFVAAIVGASVLVIGGVWWLAHRRPPPPAPPIPKQAPKLAAEPTPEPTPATPVEPAPVEPAPIEPPRPAVTPSPAVSHRPPAAIVLGRAEEARSLIKQGKSHQARRMLEELDSDPRARAPVKLGLAELAYGESNYDDAIELASQAVHAGAGADALMVRALSEMKTGRIDQAEHDFDRVLAIDPKNEDAREGKRLAQLRKGNP
jgi:tetratricopeptide (TPR) repeat protein